MNPFTLAAVNFAWLPLLPLITVAVGAMIIMMVGPSVEDDDSAGLGLIALITVFAAFVLTLFTLGQNTLAFGGALAVDNYAGFFEIVILAATGVTIGMSLDYVADEGLAGAEYYALLLFAAFGMMLMAAAGDLIIIFLGLETMSISRSTRWSASCAAIRVPAKPRSSTFCSVPSRRAFCSTASR